MKFIDTTPPNQPTNYAFVIPPPQPHEIGCLDEQPATWAELVAVEPRVDVILGEARKARRQSGNRWAAYSYFKARLSKLVGWDARNPRLASSACYDVAIRQLTKALGV